MRGEFYTERDIEDMIRKGQTSLQLGEQDRITDLARERAEKDGLQLLGPHESSSQVARQAASVRYAQQPEPQTSKLKPPAKPVSQGHGDLHQRIKGSVMAKLGDSVDPKLLDVVIRRVLDQLGLA
ncbi:MAG: hypothetical protein ACLFWD_02895 [Anaerolineales bacterium]